MRGTVKLVCGCSIEWWYRMSKEWGQEHFFDTTLLIDNCGDSHRGPMLDVHTLLAAGDFGTLEQVTQ